MTLPAHKRTEMVEVLPEHMDFFRRRTEGLINACIAREMSVQSIAASCYRQGLEDALQVLDKGMEEDGYGFGV